MLFREADARTQIIDLRLAATLSFVAGALNAVGFEVAGLFSANMTGNISAMADKLAQGEAGVALLLGLIFGAFLLGAFLAGLAIEIGLRRGHGAIYALLILAEGAILVGVGGIDVFGPQPIGGIRLIAVLGFLLGLQNAVTTRISRARVRTTHISGMATDLGLVLAGIFTGGDSAQQRARLALYALTLMAFFTGGLLGASVLAGIGAATFLLWGAVLMALAARELWRNWPPATR